MKIFLTGEIQIGKTTIIQKAIELLMVDYGGFKTYFGPDRDLANRLLYMNSITEANIYSAEYGIVRFSDDSKPQVIDNRFDTFGAELIKNAIENKELIIMDECGRLERDSLEFQKGVLKALESDIPILGVIKLDSSGWVDQIRKHPSVKLITVTSENRNDLPKVLQDELSKELQKRKGD